MKIVQVDISRQKNMYRVFWHEWIPYTIDKKVVDSCASEVRKVLLELVNHCLTNDLRTAGPILKRLASKGSSLHQALFTKVDGDIDPRRIKAHYEALQEPIQLDFRVSNEVSVPWGLVYSSDPSSLPDSWSDDPEQPSWKQYRDFWCFCRDLTIRYDRIPPDHVGDASHLSMLRIINLDTFDKAKTRVTSEPELAFLGWLEKQYSPPLNTEVAIKQVWYREASATGLLYFYCHAGPSTLAIGEDASLAAHELYLLIGGPERKPGPGCLVLINGCRTAVGDSKGDFMLASSTNGLCGYVGTETDIPDVFALRFSTSLLHSLFREGNDLGQAMHKLYRDHFPLSLVYGVYADRRFRMSQKQAPEMASDKLENYSRGIVGTRVLEAINDK